MKTLNLMLIGSLLLAVTGCGNDSKSSNRKKEKNAVCSDLNCLSMIDWKIQLQGRAFPDNTRLDINGTTVLNECVSKQRYSINRASEPQSVVLENYFIPKAGHLKIDVVDLGHCDEAVSFISNDDVDFDVVKSISGREILINL